VTAGSPAVIAHRGFHATAPENTLEAFAAAVELGVDMVELDVQETADGELVVYHDDAVEGTLVSRMSYDELRTRLPAELADAGKAHIVTSFDPIVLRSYRNAAPTTKRGLIVGAEEGGVTSLLEAVTGAEAHLLVIAETLASDDLLWTATMLEPPLVWAVNDEGSLTTLLSHPAVGGVLTDRPDLALAIRETLGR
jgi:glycerophosphoryl diester phosphodiesterase